MWDVVGAAGGEIVFQGGYGVVTFGLELVWGCLLDAFYGCGELVDCLKDAICGSHYRDGNGMMFVPEHVRDTLANGVPHDDLDAPIMLEGRTDVPRVQCMKTLCQTLVGLMMCQSLGA